MKNLPEDHDEGFEMSDLMSEVSCAFCSYFSGWKVAAAIALPIAVFAVCYTV